MSWTSKEIALTKAAQSAASSYYVEAIRFVDLTTQSGAGLNAFDTVLLGPGGSDAEGLVTMSSTKNQNPITLL